MRKVFDFRDLSEGKPASSQCPTKPMWPASTSDPLPPLSQFTPSWEKKKNHSLGIYSEDCTAEKRCLEAQTLNALKLQTCILTYWCNLSRNLPSWQLPYVSRSVWGFCALQVGMRDLMIVRGEEIEGLPEGGKYSSHKLANFKGPCGRNDAYMLFKEITVVSKQTSATYHFTRLYFLSLNSSLWSSKLWRTTTC